MFKRSMIVKHGGMKSMLFVIFIILSSEALCQKDESNSLVNIQPHIAFPIGDISKSNGIELGGHFSFEKTLAARTRLLFQLGGGLLPGKTDDDPQLPYPIDYPAITLLQLRIGGKYFISNSGLFAGGLVGGVQSFSGGSSSFGFSYAPIVGFEFGNIHYYDITLSYDNSILNNYTVSTVAFSIGFHF